MKKIAFKLSNGDELTEAERLKLWDNGDDIRKLGKDAAHTDDGNLLIKGLTDDAIKSGDKARMQKLADEIKADKENCVKLGECAGTSAISSTLSSALSSTPVLALGILTAAGLTMTTMTDADGKMWKFNNDTQTYYEIIPKGPKIVDVTYSHEQSAVGPEDVNAAILPAWKALMNSEIPYEDYTVGELEGIQGTKYDISENICQNFAIKGINAINNDENVKKANLVAKVVNIIGTDVNGEVISHTAVMIENKNKVIATYTDQLTGKTENIYEKTIIEPQTGQTSYSGSDLTHTKMMTGDTEYNMEYIQELTNATQEYYPQYDDTEDNTIIPEPGSKEGGITATLQDEYAPTMSNIVKEGITAGLSPSDADKMLVDAWWSQGKDVKIVNKK
jgi:hypothetical protein